VRFIENIKVGRDDLHEEIAKDEEEKQHLEQQIALLSERLQQVSESLVKKYEAQEEFDRSISESE